MGLFKGGALRIFQTLLYALAFCCAAIVLGIYSYFLAVLADKDLHIPKWEKAVEGLSGVAVLYTICTTLLTCCLAGVAFLSVLGIFFDLCFVGAFIAIAVLTRHGADSCRGNVNTPLGKGLASADAPGAGDYRYVCKLNTAVFAVSLVAVFLFLLTALMQIVIMRQHKKEKRFGPSPANNYTSGRGRGRFGRKNKTSTADTEKGVIGTLGHPANGADIRPSHDTAYTGSTVGAPGANLQKDIEIPDAQARSHAGHAPHVGWNPHTDGAAATTTTQAPYSTHDGYYTAPVGSENPYGYDNTATASTGTARNF